MNVLIIGGTGVISNQVRGLIERLENEVTVINRGNKAVSFSKNTRYFRADINDLEQIKVIIGNHYFDVVIDFLSFYMDDIFKRYELLKGKIGQFIINDREYYNYDFLLQSILDNPAYLQKISPVVASLTHDDLTIENVIVGNDQYILVDPRGVSDTGLYRDYVYDIAKFTCTLSGFTSVKYGNFKADIEENCITYVLSDNVQKKYDKYYDYVVDCSKYYCEKYFPEDKYWRERLMFSEGCHYLADIACRMYNGDSYEKLIALYARGIEVLNELYNEIKE